MPEEKDSLHSAGLFKIKITFRRQKFTQATRVPLLAKRAVQKQEGESLDEEKLSDSTQIYPPCRKLLKKYNFYFS